MVRFKKRSTIRQTLALLLAGLGVAAAACSSGTTTQNNPSLSVEQAAQVLNYPDILSSICTQIGGDGVWHIGGVSSIQLLDRELSPSELKEASMGGAMAMEAPKRALVSVQVLASGVVPPESRDARFSGKVPETYSTMEVSVENAQVSCTARDGFNRPGIHENNLNFTTTVTVAYDSAGNLIGGVPAQ